MLIHYDARITAVTANGDGVRVTLADGRILQFPLSWGQRLEGASPAQLARVEISGAGYGLHWPELDEDIHVSSLLGPHSFPNA